jgi:hypothetical protein
MFMTNKRNAARHCYYRSHHNNHYHQRRRPPSSIRPPRRVVLGGNGRCNNHRNDDEEEAKYQRASMVLEHFRSFRHAHSLDSISEDGDWQMSDESDFLRFFTVGNNGGGGAGCGIGWCPSSVDGADGTATGGMKRSQTYSSLRSLDVVTADINCTSSSFDRGDPPDGLAQHNLRRCDGSAGMDRPSP